MKNESLTLTFALIVRALIGFVAASCLAIFLVPDEAQYWLWSHDLGWSYYSKPPGIAYQIAAGTALFGDHEFGVRFFSVIISFMIGLALYRVARGAKFTKEISLYAALLFCFSPLGILGSFAATTDAGMLFFSILAFGSLLKAPPRWLHFGLYVMLAALFKWTALLLWPAAFLGVILYPTWRKKSVWGGLALTLVAFLPALIWNWQNDFASFLHVYTQAVPAQKSSPNPGTFLLAQIALLFPIPFYYFVKALLRSLKTKKPQAISFTAYTAALFFALFWALSFCQKVQINWALLFMPFAALAASAVAAVRWLKISLVLSTLLSLIMLLVPFLERHERTAISYRYNIFKDAMGFDELQVQLQKLPARDFLFSNSYQMASILSFYGPLQKRAYLLNIEQRRHSHFSYMPSLREEQLHKSGYFVRLEEKTFDHEAASLKAINQLAPYFASVKLVGIYPIFTSNGRPVKWVIILDCLDYNGLEPPPSKTF